MAKGMDQLPPGWENNYIPCQLRVNTATVTESATETLKTRKLRLIVEANKIAGAQIRGWLAAHAKCEREIIGILQPVSATLAKSFMDQYRLFETNDAVRAYVWHGSGQHWVVMLKGPTLRVGGRIYYLVNRHLCL